MLEYLYDLFHKNAVTQQSQINLKEMIRRNKSMKNLRLIPVMILITALTGLSALAGAPAESGEEDALTYLGRELEMTAEHLIRTGEDTDDVYNCSQRDQYTERSGHDDGTIQG